MDFQPEVYKNPPGEYSYQPGDYYEHFGNYPDYPCEYPYYPCGYFNLHVYKLSIPGDYHDVQNSQYIQRIVTIVIRNCKRGFQDSHQDGQDSHHGRQDRCHDIQDIHQDV